MKRRGFTLIELMIVVAIIAIIAAIAVPNLISALKSGNETRAIALLKILTSVNAQYKTQNSAYAAAGSDLAGAGLISVQRGETLDSGNESDYNFSYSGSTSTYTCYANPMTNSAGSRSFFVNESGDLRYVANTDATQHSSGGDAWNVLGK